MPQGFAGAFFAVALAGEVFFDEALAAGAFVAEVLLMPGVFFAGAFAAGFLATGLAVTFAGAAFFTGVVAALFLAAGLAAALVGEVFLGAAFAVVAFAGDFEADLLATGVIFDAAGFFFAVDLVAGGVTGGGAAFLSGVVPRPRLKTRLKRPGFCSFFPALDFGGVRCAMSHLLHGVTGSKKTLVKFHY